MREELLKQEVPGRIYKVDACVHGKLMYSDTYDSFYLAKLAEAYYDDYGFEVNVNILRG